MANISASFQLLFSHEFLNTFFAAALVVLLVYYLGVPRRKNLPPGPKPWPVLGNLPHLRMPLYRRMAELAQEHGPLMTLYFGPKICIVISSPELAKEILQTHDKSTASRISTIAGNIFSNDGRGILLSPYGPHFRKVKKLASLHLLTQNRVRTWTDKRLEIVNQMTDFLWNESKANGGVVEVRRFLYQATLNTIMSMSAGKSYQFASTGQSPLEGDILSKLVKDLLICMAELNIAEVVPLLSPFDPQGVASRSRKAKKRFEMYAIELLEERARQRKKDDFAVKSQDSRDFVDVLLDMEEEEGLTRLDMTAIIQDMFLAGMETSASTTEWALAELMANPDKMEKLRDELREAELSPQTDFSQFTYLQAVIKETYRHHNVVPFLVPRLSIESFTINGYPIPPNTTIFINTWAITHDPKVWKEPMKFYPERFLEENTDFRGHDFRLIPFGSGRRMCSGMFLGHSNVELMLSALVKKFLWNLPPGESSVDLTDQYVVVANLVKPLKARIAPV